MFGIENVITFVMISFVFGLEMKVRTALPLDAKVVCFKAYSLLKERVSSKRRQWEQR